MPDTTRVPLSPSLDQWDLIIDALQAAAEYEDDIKAGQVYSNLATLLRNGIDRVVPGTYGGCEDITAVTDDEAALFPPAATPDLGDLHDSIISRLDGASGGTCEHCVSSVFTRQADAVIVLVDQFLAASGVLRESRNENPVAPEPEPEPPLPPGFFGRVELPGWRNYTGWITEGTAAGQPVRLVSDWDGLVLAEYQPGPNSLTVRLPTPQKRPEPQKAIAAAPQPFGSGYDDDPWHSDGGDDPEGCVAHAPGCHRPDYCDGECTEGPAFR